MKQLTTHKLTRFLSVLCLGLTVFATFSTALADDSQNGTSAYQDEMNCLNATDIDTCLQNQSSGNQQQQHAKTKPSIDLNSNQFLNTDSPITVSFKYDPDLNMIFGLDYVHAFINNAIAFKLDGGANEMRGNVTIGHNFDQNNQLKLTYEYLAQNLAFDFASGTVHRWVGQNALGADYRYLLNHTFFHSVDLEGSYIKANSQNLNTVLFPLSDGTYAENYRHIAGGQEENAGVKTTVTPFSRMAITVGGGYSHLAYDTRYANRQNNSTLAYNAELTTLLTSKTKLHSSIDHTAATTDHRVTLSQLLPHHLEASLQGEYDAGQGELRHVSSALLSLSYPAPDHYTLNQKDSLQSLSDWVKTPAVYATQVFAIKDEMIKQVTIDSEDFTEPNVKVGSLIQAVNTDQLFHYNANTFDKIDYQLTVKDSAGNSIDYQKDLGLEFAQASNSLQYLLKSTNPMPVSALINGENTTYTFTITAEGYKNGTKIAEQNSSFDLTVTPSNASIQTKSINDQTANTGGNYSVDTDSLFSFDPNEFKQISYSFKVVDGDGTARADNLNLSLDNANPASPYNTNLQTTSSETIPNDAAQAGQTQNYTIKVTATGTSNGGGTVTAENDFTLKVTNPTIIPPTWTQNNLNPSSVIIAGNVTDPNYKYDVDLNSSTYISNCNNDSGCTFEIDNEVPSWLKLSSDKTHLVINPSDISAASVFTTGSPEIPVTLTPVTIINGQTIKGNSKSFTITVAHNPALADSIKWTGGSLPVAQVGSPYENNQVNITHYITGIYTNDQITTSFPANKNPSWLTLGDFNVLTGTPTINDIGYATVNVKIYSAAAGKTVTIPSPAPLQIEYKLGAGSSNSANIDYSNNYHYQSIWTTLKGGTKYTFSNYTGSNVKQILICPGTITNSMDVMNIQPDQCTIVNNPADFNGATYTTQGTGNISILFLAADNNSGNGYPNVSEVTINGEKS